MSGIKYLDKRVISEEKICTKLRTLDDVTKILDSYNIKYQRYNNTNSVYVGVIAKGRRRFGLFMEFAQLNEGVLLIMKEGSFYSVGSRSVNEMNESIRLVEESIKIMREVMKLFKSFIDE